MKQQIKMLANQMRTAQNPQAFLNQMLSTNPQLSSAVEYIKANGGNPQTAFFNYARELGIDPQQFINQIKASLQ